MDLPGPTQLQHLFNVFDYCNDKDFSRNARLLAARYSMI